MKEEDVQSIKSRFFNKADKSRQANTTVYTHGKDTGEVFPVGTVGNDTFTSHLKQTYDYTDVQIEYRFNSYRTRGPEPVNNSKTKILVAGGSFAIGTGVNYSDTFASIVAETLNADHFNLSEYDSLYELIDPLQDIKDAFEPDYVIIQDTRFISEMGWIMKEVLSNSDKEKRQFFWEIFDKTNVLELTTMDAWLNQTFPDAKIIWLVPEQRRKHFKNLPDFKYSEKLEYNKSHMVDLARDNVHPGPKSHVNIADIIIKFINENR